MLPIMTNPRDACDTVAYLRTKATGATVKDAKATLPARLLDSRKLSAYEAWGLITQENDRIRLTSLGRGLARGSEEVARGVFADVVLSNRAYRIAAEWIHHQGLQTVPVEDLAAHWFEHVQPDLGTTAEKTIRNQAACFFSLAEGAGLGEYILGRRGQPTRLEVDRDALDELVSGGTVSTAAIEPEESQPLELEKPGEPQAVEPQDSTESEAEVASEQAVSPEPIASHAIEGTTPRVFISHGPNTAVVDQVKTMLDLSELKYEVVVEQESAAIPVPDKVFEAMRRCNAAVICVTADAGENGGIYEINPNVLIEIGAAFVLYERRVALLWDRRMNVPSNLQGLYRCEFEGAEMTWSDGMKLMKAVNDFKNIG